MGPEDRAHLARAFARFEAEETAPVCTTSLALLAMNAPA
jgi:hypothetical protein